MASSETGRQLGQKISGAAPLAGVGTAAELVPARRQARGAEIVVGPVPAWRSLVPARGAVGWACLSYPVRGAIVRAAGNCAPAARHLGGHPRVLLRSQGVSPPERPSHFGRAHW